MSNPVPISTSRSCAPRLPCCASSGHHGRTWVSGTAEGPRFDRYVRIDAADGAMCAQAVTTWVLIEQATGRPRRVPAWMVEMFA